ncbi:hypothetical protein [Streptomyces anulatus]|uniref:SMI1/KNR4 family protein n=1 Tax=Streptomyces anulatus TaxID=1892 RepID=A0ABZ1ZJ60_STRAQ|nr:hypothetical protein [Streptomyces anulatus]WSV75993.1 hypothetical protein OG333_17305 [Streptomyces anulatus]WSW83974.1 hypothetical protein OG536_17735 [Streptomyces anulatus]
MGAEYYRADSEDGDRIDDPSEDALFMLIEDLNVTDNTFVLIRPDEETPTWFASVTMREEGGYEVVRGYGPDRENDVVVESGIDRMARDLTVWMAARIGH